MRLVESAYEWAIIPEDLPKGNLVLITAKTTLPTLHGNDPDYPVRIFNKQELREAARSLAKRPMGINHGKLIEGAFTVDAQWNESTDCIEALVFLPTPYINLIRREEASGSPIKYSVEYTWRDEKRTESGVEFIGLIFDRVDLVYGMKAGDMATSGRLVETEIGIHRHLMEAEGTPIVDIDEKHLEEAYGEWEKHLGEPFASYKDWDDCIAKNKNKSSPEKYCGYIKHQTEDKKKKETEIILTDDGIKQLPEIPLNTMTSPTDVILPPVDLPTSQPHDNVTSIGAIPDNMGGPIGLTPAVGNPDKNLNQEPAKEDVGKMDSYKEKGNPVIENSKVLSPDNSNQSVECMEENKKLKESVDIPKEPEKPIVSEVSKEPIVSPVQNPPVPPIPPVLDTKDTEIKNLSEAVTRLQVQVSSNDKEKEKAVKESYIKGKEAVINKVREVVPVSGFIGGNIAVTATKRVFDDINRKLRECVVE